MNAKTKHTAGPWIAEGTYVGDGKPCGEFQSLVIADCESRHRQAKEQLANARLIAAAPELLEALRDLLGAASLSAARGVAFSIDSPGIVAARAAIARATREQP